MKQSYSMFLACMLLLTGCLGDDEDSDTTIVLYEGDEPGECSDEADNDKDGLFDCDDDQCSGSPACKEDETPIENNTVDPKQNNTEEPEQNNTEEKYVPGLDYGTGWSVSDVAHNINFTMKDGEMFELYEIPTDFAAVTFVATWSGQDLSQLGWKSGNTNWQSYSEDITDITVVMQNNAGENPSLSELRDLDAQFPNSTIFTKNAMLMTDVPAMDAAGFQNFPNTILMEKNDAGKFVINSINPSFNEIMDEIDDFGISGTGYTVGHVPYNFRFVDHNSPEMEHYSLYDFKGEYVIVEVGALWCSACDITEEILNDFDQIYDDFIVISLMQEGETAFIPPTDLELENHLTSQGRTLLFHLGYSEDFPSDVYFSGYVPHYVIYGPSESLGKEMVVLDIIPRTTWDDVGELRSVLDEIKNRNLEEPEEDIFTIPFSQCTIFVEYSNDTKNLEVDEAFEDISLVYPEWCNYQQNGAERLTLDSFSEMSEVYYDLNNRSYINESSYLYQNYWLEFYNENNGYFDYILVLNFSTEKGPEWFGEEYCSEEYDEYGLTSADILGLGVLCGGTSFDLSSSTSSYYIIDSGKFYCVVDLVNGVAEPQYCERYELVNISGIEYLFLAAVTDFTPSIEEKEKKK
jgi:thiol-disulfide isomerase/thioredoxin|tara:strand:+ start:217 stop:2112 length:1896 start_codon:yes stop_codon:yes gene_type:complete